MTKRQMIINMVGKDKKPEFYRRAEKKNKQWMEKLYAMYLETGDSCRDFCFQLLNY